MSGLRHRLPRLVRQNLCGAPLPILRQSRHIPHLLQLVLGRFTPADELDETGEGESWIETVEKLYSISEVDDPWLENSVVPAGTPVANHRLGQVFIIETQGQLEAGLSRLAHLHSRAADPMDVTNTQVAFRQALNG